MPRRQLLLVVVVFGVAAGPLDPGSGLTGTLHYTFLCQCDRWSLSPPHSPAVNARVVPDPSFRPLWAVLTTSPFRVTSLSSKKRSSGQNEKWYRGSEAGRKLCRSRTYQRAYLARVKRGGYFNRTFPFLPYFLVFLLLNVGGRLRGRRRRRQRADISDVSSPSG